MIPVFNFKNLLRASMHKLEGMKLMVEPNPLNNPCYGEKLFMQRSIIGWSQRHKLLSLIKLLLWEDKLRAAKGWVEKFPSNHCVSENKLLQTLKLARSDRAHKAFRSQLLSLN